MSKANNNPIWLKPLWRRVALVVFTAAWASFEFYSGATGWALAFGALAVYGAWQYLYAWQDPVDPADSRPADVE
ncbi:MAG: DUF3329 domain-containing protein [Rhizobiaceae bacterium]|nr:DUF3329 domain-containing protein [Rhizobiaceae bacterium]